MQLDLRRAGPGAALDLAIDAAAGDTALAVRGRGRGSVARIPAAPLTLCFCFAGTMEVDAGDGPFRLARRQFLALPGGAGIRAVGRESADWALLVLPPSVQSAAERALDRGHRSPVALSSGPLLFPATLPMTAALRRALVPLQRAAGGRCGDGLDLLLAALLQAARQAQQASADAWLRRASGRSERHRRHAVLRLLSARNRILNAPFDNHDLETLAAVARYSKSHFLRMFRDMFGSTPHDLVISARMELAKDLITNSDLAISEIAASVGYESRFAFARLFKKRTGMTASDYRQDGAEELRQAA